MSIEHKKRVLAHGAKVAASITDTQRIDLLERLGDVGQFQRINNGRWIVRDNHGTHSTLREAIDAVIRVLDMLAKSERKPPRKVTT